MAQDLTDRCPMGIRRAPASQIAQTSRRPWAPVARFPAGVERHPVGAAHRCAMVGDAKSLSPVSNLSPSLPAMAPIRCHGPPAAGPGPGPGTAREDKPARVFHRWQFQSCEKGGAGVGKTKRGKGSKVMAITDRAGLPIALCTGSASPHETKYIKELIDHCFTKKKPERLIGDKAYDSDPLDEQCHATGITMIAPHKSNRKKPASQDSRALRRYKRRWKVERLFSWLQNYRRLVTCFEYYVENFLALLKLAAFMILAKKYL